jgi:hypothetical protein
MTLKRKLPGLYEGERIRCERKEDGLWYAQAKAREVGKSGLFEAHHAGHWVPCGRFKTLAIIRHVDENLRAGEYVIDLHVFKDGRGSVVPRLNVEDRIKAACAADQS